jgi:hypothetical protein
MLFSTGLARKIPNCFTHFVRSDLARDPARIRRKPMSHRIFATTNPIVNHAAQASRYGSLTHACSPSDQTYIKEQGFKARKNSEKSEWHEVNSRQSSRQHAKLRAASSTKCRYQATPLNSLVVQIERERESICSVESG